MPRRAASVLVLGVGAASVRVLGDGLESCPSGLAGLGSLLLGFVLGRRQGPPSLPAHGYLGMPCLDRAQRSTAASPKVLGFLTRLQPRLAAAWASSKNTTTTTDANAYNNNLFALTWNHRRLSIAKSSKFMIRSLACGADADSVRLTASRLSTNCFKEQEEE